ncbi:hypothetical protein AB0912_12280 [Streptomyces sp. NPDC007084]|uniref:hypothetical protein n=1 Tax=Streptomyces sp. NPDC007084 TaxID=3154313 RepID=UPI003455B8A4
MGYRVQLQENSTNRITPTRRTRAPALPLAERVNHLTGLTVAPAGAGHHDLVARTCAALNYAALIASDVGRPELAEELRQGQHPIFADAGRLSRRIAIMPLMPARTRTTAPCPRSCGSPCSWTAHAPSSRSGGGPRH